MKHARKLTNQVMTTDNFKFKNARRLYLRLFILEVYMILGL